MSSNEIKTNDMNGSQLTEPRPLSGRCSRQGNIGRDHANSVISKRKKWTSQENKIVMESYILSEPKIRGYRKRVLSLWLQKGMFWVSEQRLVDQANTIRRNSWMTELKIEELESKATVSDSVIVEEARSVEVLFKTHSMAKTNNLFYAAFVATNRLGVKIDKYLGERNKCRREGCKIRLKSLGRT